MTEQSLSNAQKFVRSTVEGKLLGLFLDDVRWPIEMYPSSKDNVVWRRCKTQGDFLHAMLRDPDRYGRLYDVIAFDYFLGTQEESNGDDCLDLLLHYCIINKVEIPRCLFHSSDKRVAQEMFTKYVAALPEERQLQEMEGLKLPWELL